MAEETTRVLQFEFRDYFDVIRRRKWTVACAVATVTAVALLLSFRETKVYRATAEILVDSTDDPSAGNVVTKPDLTTEVRLLTSAAVRSLAAKQLPQVGSVSGRSIGLRTMEVSVQDTDPARAAKSVEVYVKAFTDYRHDQMLSRLLGAADEAQAKIDNLGAEVTKLNGELNAQLESVQHKYAPVAGDSPTAALRRAQDSTREQAAVQDAIRPRRDSFQRQQILLEQTLQDLQIKSQRATQSLQVITPPSVPSSPIRPKPMQDGVRGFAMGLALGVLLAFLFEYLDDGINTRDDVERAVGSVPLIGAIPHTDWKDAGRPEVVSLTAPRSPATEAYRSLRTTVNFLGLEEAFGSLAVTSPLSGEGKTTTLANLAVVMAGAGMRVVILDADLRRPRIHSFFGLSNEIGFTSVLIGDAPLSAALQPIPVDGQLHILPSGPIPPNPSELLSSRRFTELIKSLQVGGAFVLIDTPPLLPVTDAAVIATSIDQLILVTSVGRSTKKQLRHAMQILGQVDAPLAGIVLNRVDSDREGYYHYYAASPDGGRRLGDRLNGNRLRSQSSGASEHRNGNGDKAPRAASDRHV